MKLSFWGCLAIGFNAGFVAIILFIICQTLYAQGIKSMVDAMMISDNYWAFIITILGLFLSMAIATIAGIVIADNLPKGDVYRASGFALILNFLVWVLLCYIVVFIYAPESAFEGYTWLDAFVGLPRIITFAAEYRFTSVPLFWIYFTVTYEFWFGFFLWFFEARTNPLRKYKQQEKAKR